MLGGKDALTEYEFGNKNVTHLFCGNCGVSVTVTTEKFPVQPVNVRTMNDVDLRKLKVTQANGWGKMEPQYTI